MSCGFVEQFRLTRVGFYSLIECANLVDETFDILEAAMDRGVAQIGDFIEIAEPIENLLPDLRGRDFTAGGFDIVDDFIDRFLERDETDAAFLASFGDAVGELAAIETRMRAVAFDDAQICALDLFVGSETKGTGETDAPPPDAGMITRRPGIDNLVVILSAFGAAHDVAEN